MRLAAVVGVQAGGISTDLGGLLDAAGVPGDTRFSPGQLRDAISRSARGGDPRFNLLEALAALPGAESSEALIGLIDGGDLQAREWFTASLELVRRHPGEHLTRTVRQGLDSRSLEVQQTVVVHLPDWAHAGVLTSEHIEMALSWLDRRLGNLRREATADPWEVVDVALATALIRGPQVAHELLVERVPRMLRDERERVSALPPPSSPEFLEALEVWSDKGGGDEFDETYADPTATRYIDKIMRRLRIAPANPEVETLVESWEGWESKTLEINDDDSEELTLEKLRRVFRAR